MHTYTYLDGYGTINKNNLTKIPALLEDLSNSVQGTRESSSDISSFRSSIKKVQVNATALYKNVK